MNDLKEPDIYNIGHTKMTHQKSPMDAIIINHTEYSLTVKQFHLLVILYTTIMNLASYLLTPFRNTLAAKIY